MVKRSEESSEGWEVGHVPEIQIGRAGDLDNFFVIDAVCVVRRLVIVGMTVGMIPDDGDVTFCERSVVAATYRTVARDGNSARAATRTSPHRF